MKLNYPKRLFGFLILCFTVINVSHADWVKINENQNKEISNFVDYERKRTSGSKVEMWSLTDFKAIQFDNEGKAYKSIKYYSVYDCEKFSNKVLYEVKYIGNLGSGDILSSLDLPNGNFTPVIPDSIGEISLKIACDLGLKYSDWIMHSSSDDKTLSFFYSPNSIVYQNNKIIVSQLINSKDAFYENYKSVYSKDELDCNLRTQRSLLIQFFTENMGRGVPNNVLLTPNTYVENIPDGSNADSLLKKVCSK